MMILGPKPPHKPAKPSFLAMSKAWRQGDVSEELSRGRRRQVQTSTVRVRVLFTNHIGVKDFEDLIETELAETLSGVAEEGWSPTLGQTFHALFSKRNSEAVEDRFVLCWVDLDAALH